MDTTSKHPIKLSPKQSTVNTKQPTGDVKRPECAPKTNWVKTGDICQLYGVYPTTVRKWEQTGRLKAIKTPAGQRLYDLPTVQALMGQTSAPEEISSDPPPVKENIIYSRISSDHQKADLQRQIEFLVSKYPTYRVIQDVGSGLNFKRAGLRSILDLALKGNLDTLVVSHKDRLCCLGFELIEYIVKNKGGKIIVLDQDTQSLSSNEELAEELLSVITIFNTRHVGRKKYKKRQDLHQTSDGELSEHS